MKVPTLKVGLLAPAARNRDGFGRSLARVYGDGKKAPAREPARRGGTKRVKSKIAKGGAKTKPN
ncbi:unnamed protein product [marine sediment metagenome]|uniref:Uncharacterized protein n=1 Tax=marine sediment metagenome TaxID=412755 RepID=X1JBS8_9ZZZZ